MRLTYMCLKTVTSHFGQKSATFLRRSGNIYTLSPVVKGYFKFEQSTWSFLCLLWMHSEKIFPNSTESSNSSSL